jgi:hypothetical protein
MKGLRHLHRLPAYLLLPALLISLTACSQLGVSLADSPRNGSPQALGDDQTEEYTALVAALRATGAAVEEMGEIKQASFPVAGHAMTVNGSLVQVFEFSDEADRQEVSDEISRTGTSIGPSLPAWIEEPSIWAKGRLIVLYAGRDRAVADMLTSILGEAITQPGPAASLPPQAILDARKQVADALGVPVEQLQLVSVDQVQWSDACLGLPRPDEMCAQAAVPGWRAIFDVNGQEVEVRTNLAGDVVRWKQLEGSSLAGAVEKARRWWQDLKSGDLPAREELEPRIQAALDKLETAFERARAWFERVTSPE